jgi:hypothetical protein
MITCTVNEKDKFLDNLTDTLQTKLPPNIKVVDYHKPEEVNGFYLEFDVPTPFIISFEIPAAGEQVPNLPNMVAIKHIYVKLQLDKHFEHPKLHNQSSRNEFFKSVYSGYLWFKDDNWKLVQHKAGDIYILKDFVPDDELSSDNLSLYSSDIVNALLRLSNTMPWDDLEVFKS